jgi:hypothetical protein
LKQLDGGAHHNEQKSLVTSGAAECSLDERACRVGNGHDVCFFFVALVVSTPISSFLELVNNISNILLIKIKQRFYMHKWFAAQLSHEERDFE